MRDGRHPTAEQESVVDAASEGGNLVIEAGAGTGKTSTLMLVADQLKGAGIYVAFNKQIVTEARRRFGANVTCYTAHQLAYEDVGYIYGARLDGRRMRFLDVARQLGLTKPIRLADGTTITRFQAVRLAFAAIKSYCRSACDTLGMDHVPAVPGVAGPAAAELGGLVLDFAISLWEDLINPRGRFPFQHDHYLKMWSLTSPALKCDYLMFDEAQDADPLIASIVQGQECQQIAVGDRNQAIYGWRGAVDALEHWPASARLRLTQSWRFGSAIAEESNKWLAALDSPMRLTGNPAVESEVRQNPHAETVLCRTNAEAVNEVMLAVRDGHRVALVGGGNDMVNLAKASIQLKEAGYTDHPELFAFKSWREVQDYAYQDDGKDLRTFVKLVDDVGADRIVATAGDLHDESMADIVVSTCHKTKGREWPRVRIARDFYRPAMDNTATLLPISREEAMLAYVAVTRARTSLDCTTLAWINSYQPAAVFESRQSDHAASHA